MKKIFLVLLCFPLIFISCKKDEESAKDARKDFVSGCISQGIPGVDKAKQKAYCECVAEELFENSGYTFDELDKMAKDNPSQMNSLAIDKALDCAHTLQ